MDFPQKLKSLRTDKGLTQESLAIGLNVSRTLINKYERGAAQPTDENIKRIANYFGVAEEYFEFNKPIKIKAKIQFKFQWFDIIILFFPIIFIIQYFIPMYGGYYYVYPIPDGQSMPNREFLIKSSFQIFQTNDVWFGWFAIFMALLLVALITFRTALNKNKLSKYLMFFIILTFLVVTFLTITFSLGFTQ